MAVSDLLSRLRASLTRAHGPSGGPRTATPSSEQDVDRDPHLVDSRATGGEHVVLTGDTGSVTGTGETGTFVGQIAGDDLGYAEESGAERRRNPGDGESTAPRGGPT